MYVKFGYIEYEQIAIAKVRLDWASKFIIHDFSLR